MTEVKRHNQQKFLLLLCLLWAGFFASLALLAIMMRNANSVGGEHELIALVWALCIPAGIAYLYLVLEVLRAYRYKLLFLLLLIVHPPLLFVVSAAVPFSYLMLITVRYLKFSYETPPV